jgi:hypothetical protein
MKNSGRIIKLPDQRLVIVYDNQPLAKSKGKIILNLVDEKYNLIKYENSKPKIIMKDISSYNEEIKTSTLIGYVN